MATKTDELIRGYTEYYKGVEIEYEMYMRLNKEIRWEAHLELGGKKLVVPTCDTYGAIQGYTKRSIDNYAAELKWAKKAKRCIIFSPEDFHIDTAFLLSVSKGYKTRNYSILAYEKIPGKSPLYKDHIDDYTRNVLIIPSEQSITGAFLRSLTDAVRASQDKLYEELAEKMV